MKKYHYRILPMCMAFLFTMCQKESKPKDAEADNSTEIITAAAITEYDWQFDENIEGWSAANASVAVSGGTLQVTTTGVDPLLKSPDNLNITASATYKFVHVDMKNNSPVTTGRIYFITNTDPTWNQAKSKAFSIKANTEYYASYIIDMSTVAGWTGTIKQIRVDPLDPAPGSGQTLNIDFIRITDNKSFRGVMSPTSGFSSDLASTLKNTWKANVMRWQINSVSAGLPTTLEAYDAWLNNEMKELDNAFTWCEANGIKLLIDLHYAPLGNNSTNGTLIFYNQAANDKIVAVWQTLATRYKNRSGLYGYDLINEPVQKTTPLAGCDFKATQVKIGNAIRLIDRKTPIFIAVDDWDNPGNFTGFTPVPLTNVVYQAHMYLPHKYTHQQVSSSTPTAYTYPGTIDGILYDKARLVSLLAPVRTFQTNYNVRIYIGEFSAARWASGAATYLRDCMEIFEGYGWHWTYHAFKESKTWSLEYENLPVGDNGAIPATTPTDRYRQVVGWGLNLNQ
jgi:hypothetical protein